MKTLKLKKIICAMTAAALSAAFTITAFASQPTENEIKKAWFEYIMLNEGEATDETVETKGIEYCWHIALMYENFGLFLKTDEGKKAVKGINIKNEDSLLKLEEEYYDWTDSDDNGLGVPSVSDDAEDAEVKLKNEQIKFNNDGKYWYGINEDGKIKVKFPVLNEFKYLNEKVVTDPVSSDDSDENENPGFNESQDYSYSESEDNESSQLDDGEKTTDDNSETTDNGENGNTNGNNNPVTPKIAQEVDESKSDKDSSEKTGEISSAESEKESKSESKTSIVILVSIAGAVAVIAVVFIVLGRNKKKK